MNAISLVICNSTKSGVIFCKYFCLRDYFLIEQKSVYERKWQQR